MKIPKALAIYQSPLRLLLLIVVTLFVTHTLAMVVFAVLPKFSMWAESVIQSLLLLILLFPVLWLRQPRDFELCPLARASGPQKRLLIVRRGKPSVHQHEGDSAVNGIVSPAPP